MITAGQTVRHKTLRSLAIVRRTLTHIRLKDGATTEADRLEPFPVLEVSILTPALKSHHKPGDVVLWAEEDAIG